MERIIHFTVPAERSQLHEEAIAAARRLHPEWEVRVWEDPVSFDGALLQQWYDRPLTGAGRADLIRLDVVHRFGGIYLDGDLILQRPLDRLASLDHFFCSEDGYVVTNAAFGAARGNPHARALIDDLLAEEPDWSLRPDLATGPRQWARVLRWRQGLNVVPRDTFFPTSWAARPGPGLVTTVGVHQWAWSWVSEDERERRAARWERPQRGGPTLRERLAVRTRLRQVVLALTRSVGRLLFPPPEPTPVPAPVQYAAGDALIIETRERITIAVAAEDLSITPEIVRSGTYEPDELAFVRSVLRGGDVMVDVGCNVGMHTLVAAREVGPFGRVVAFDPNPRVLGLLRNSLRLNWLHDRVITVEAAVGAAAGSGTFVSARGDLGGGSVLDFAAGGKDEDGSALSALHAVLGSSEQREVRMLALDDEFPLGLEIKVLKIDAEGNDHEVLAGARRVFDERCVAHLLVGVFEEIAPAHFAALMDELERIESLGYEARPIEQGGTLGPVVPVFEVRRRSRTSRQFGHNVVLSRIDAPAA